MISLLRTFELSLSGKREFLRGAHLALLAAGAGPTAGRPRAVIADRLPLIRGGASCDFMLTATSREG